MARHRAQGRAGFRPRASLVVVVGVAHRPTSVISGFIQRQRNRRIKGCFGGDKQVEAPNVSNLRRTCVSTDAAIGAPRASVTHSFTLSRMPSRGRMISEREDHRDGPSFLLFVPRSPQLAQPFRDGGRMPRSIASKAGNFRRGRDCSRANNALNRGPACQRICFTGTVFRTRKRF